MKTAAFIPIKMNNERFPGKNIKPFRDGTPLIHFVQKTLLQCTGVDEKYVYCSDERIKPYILPGIEYCKRDPVFDAADMVVNDMHASVLDVVEADVYMIVHCTAPFLKKDTIEQGLEIIASGEYDSVVVGKKVQDFIWKNNEPFNFSRDHIPRTQDLEPYFIETNGMYIFTRESMARNHCRIGERPYMIELSYEEAIDIDYYEDFIIAQMMLDAKGAGTASGRGY